MNKRRRFVAVALAIAVVGLVRLPAHAHHKEGHQGGPSASPSPDPTPSPTATAAPGEDPATPCHTVGTVGMGTELRCTAVSDDGSLDLRGSVAADPYYYECSWIECGWPWSNIFPGADFQVGIDTGAGFQSVCSASTDITVIGTCGGTVVVPRGAPVECVMLVTGWRSHAGLGELSCS